MPKEDILTVLWTVWVDPVDIFYAGSMSALFIGNCCITIITELYNFRCRLFPQPELPLVSFADDLLFGDEIITNGFHSCESDEDDRASHASSSDWTPRPRIGMVSQFKSYLFSGIFFLCRGKLYFFLPLLSCDEVLRCLLRFNVSLVFRGSPVLCSVFVC